MSMPVASVSKYSLVMTSEGLYNDPRKKRWFEKDVKMSNLHTRVLSIMYACRDAGHKGSKKDTKSLLCLVRSETKRGLHS